MPTYLELRVELQHVQPAIWRRFLIRPDATFAELHDALQTACGWKGNHLYSFHAGGVGEDVIAGVPDEDDPPTPDAEQVRIEEHFGPNRSCLYLYDFGDGWEHEVSLEAEQDLAARFERKLLDGARAFPPEDCGGIGGYEDCLAASHNRARPTAAQRELLAWLKDWDPERFEVEKVARQFDRPKARNATGA